MIETRGCYRLRRIGEPMSRLKNVRLNLLGTFGIKANVGRPIAISIHSKKVRGLLAYLAMKPGYQARREELATLFWGDNPDARARHSLRQCLISLRQDLCAASEILVVDRETIGLRTDRVAVDAQSFLSLARSAAAVDLARAAQLWCGPFLPNLVLEIEEFDSWHDQEAARLETAAAGVFEAICRDADARGDREGAIGAAERLAALDPTQEDRQRTTLQVIARHVGRDAALNRAKLVTDLLRRELDVAPEAATRALIEGIKRGDFASAHDAERAQDAVEGIAPPVDLPAAALPITLRASNAPALPVPAAMVSTNVTRSVVPAACPLWRRRPLATASAAVVLVALGLLGVFGLAGPKWLLTRPQPNQSIVVLPFAAENPAQSGDPAFARALTHDLIAALSRFADLRVVSEATSESYRDRQPGVNPMTDLGVRYAIVGHVQGDDSSVKIDFQLVDTTTRTNLWSDNLQRERSDPARVAEEAARGIARMLAIEIDRLAVTATRTKPNSELTARELVDRGYLALQRGTTEQSVSDARKSFDEALRRAPHYLPAQLAQARVQIIATTNFMDLDPAPDLGATERLLNESLSKFPNWISPLYSLALLQKFHHQYQASLRALQRCLELNPSFLPAQAQIADILTRTGQPQKGLEQILQTIRVASPNDPSIGYWYLYAAAAELELGHDRAALDWALRANASMPGAPLVQAWLASIYATVGDTSNAARYAAVLTKTAPDRMRLFMKRQAENTNDENGRPALRIFEGLRQALAGSLG